MPDPFGLKAGSTPPGGMADYKVNFHAVPKPHPSFQNYFGEWTPEGGLLRVRATSRYFEDEADCFSARALYDRVKRQLQQVYGPADELELVEENSLYTGLTEFWQGLERNERHHSAFWSKDSGSNMDSQIERISLMLIAAEEYQTSFVTIWYEFAGASNAGPSDEFGMESL